MAENQTTILKKVAISMQYEFLTLDIIQQNMKMKS